MRRVVGKETGFQPDVTASRLILAGLTAGRWDHRDLRPLQALERDALAGWLVRHGLAPLAYVRCKDAFPELAAQLKEMYRVSVVRNTLQFHALSRVLSRFQESSIPVVVLKGAALAQRAYGGLALRTMGDVDLWLRDRDMERAVAIMRELGYQECVKDSRPLALQALARGERQFLSKWGLIELHWSPFPGWWLRRTAAVDDDAAWARSEPLALDGCALSLEQNMGLVRQLAPEDTVIHVAVHLAVNHRFSVGTVRGLMDIALTARTRQVDWDVVVERAERWRVRVAVWVALDLARQLIGLSDAHRALESLQPSLLRRVLLQRLVSPVSVLERKDLRERWERHLIWLLLVDRPRDAALLVSRALWPESEWLVARYGEKGDRWHHLWNAVRHGEV